MNRVSIRICAAAISSTFLMHLPAAQASTFELVYSFCSERSCTDGANPYSPRLLEFHGKLYGTTYMGGDHLSGTIFEIDPKSGAEEVAHSFNENVLTEGAFPVAGLVNVKGTFYGTTRNGGLYEIGGTVFSFDPTSRLTTVLYSFNTDFGLDAYFPQSGVVKVKDAIYGTTVAGGSGFSGTVFSFGLKSGVEKVVYSFSGGPDGSIPESGLLNLNGTLYGTTYNGGSNSHGTLFALDPKTGAETVLNSFPAGKRDGASPAAGLISVNGVLYGTTSRGGEHNGGTLFSFDPTTGVEKTVYAFCKRHNCADGSNPMADLLNVNGVLYGTTANGGRYDWGAVFSLDLNSGNEMVVHSFNQIDGATPLAPLTEVNGKLFGTTQRGGAHEAGECFQYGCGTVFSIGP